MVFDDVLWLNFICTDGFFVVNIDSVTEICVEGGVIINLGAEIWVPKDEVHDANKKLNLTIGWLSTGKCLICKIHLRGLSRLL